MSKLKEAPKRNAASEASTDLYLRDIRKYTPLERADEAEMMAQARRGNKDALDKLITANLRFVVRVAGEYTHRGLPLSDLIAEGNVGLIRATRTYEPERGLKFITYAVWWIRQSILTALQKQTRPITFPANQIDDLDTVNRTANVLSQQLGRSPDLQELASVTEMTDRRVRKAIRTGQSSISMESPVYEDGNVRFGDTLPSNEPEPDERMDADLKHKLLKEGLNSLPAREAEIISRYFGLNSDEHESLEQVGKRFHISRERVRQLKDRALGRLRERMDLEECTA
jgi:RNA polymerase primary sigma factor